MRWPDIEEVGEEKGEGWGIGGYERYRVTLSALSGPDQMTCPVEFLDSALPDQTRTTLSLVSIQSNIVV